MESISHVKANILCMGLVDFSQFSTHIWGYLIVNILSLIETLDWTYEVELLW